MGTTQIRVIIPIAIPGQPEASAHKPVMEPAEPRPIHRACKPDASTDDQRTPKAMFSIPTCEAMFADRRLALGASKPSRARVLDAFITGEPPSFRRASRS